MWILLFFAIIGLWFWSLNTLVKDDWRTAFVVGLVIFQSYLVLVTEVLSLFGAVTRLGLSLAWGLLAAGMAVWGWQRVRHGKQLRLPKIHWPNQVSLWVVDGIILLILLVTLVIGLSAPPNTADSLVYHMPRLAHWAQDASVHHFPTGIEYYNSYPPGAEMQMLHFYILSGGDHLVNLQGWLAFLGSMLAAAALSRLLGLGSTGQHFAALFVAAMPVALAHASSSKNDLAVAFWVIVVVLLAFQFLKQGRHKKDLILLGLTAGLAMLTKQAAAIFLAPFALWFAFRLWKSLSLKKFALWSMILVLIVLALNAGYLLRNLQTYGHLVDPLAMSQHRNQAFSFPILMSNLARNLSSHAQTPWPWSRAWIYDRMVGFHDLIGVDIDDPRLTVNGDYEVPGFITSEVVSGNPLHMALILLAFLIVWVLAFWRRMPKSLLVLSLCAFAGFILFSAVFKWQIFSARYHLPFFMLSAPVVAYLVDAIDKQGWLSALIGVIMLGLAGLWLVSLRPRPIIPWKGMTRDFSIFEDRTGLYYPGPMMQNDFENLGQVLRDSGCKDVGIRLRGSSMEYLYWVALDLPETDFRLTWLVAGTPSAQYRDPDFSPCAVICEDCPAEQMAYDDLPLFLETAFFKLFLDSSGIESP